MKYTKSLICIILVAVLLSGCSFRLASSVNELVSPISPFGDNANIKEALDSYVGSSYTLKNPTSGDYITSYNFYDIDGDGENEAVAFYEMKNALGYIKIALLKQYDNVWRVLTSSDGLGESAYRLDFGDVNNDGKTEIIVLWNTISNSTSHSLMIYTIEENDTELYFSPVGDDKTINNYAIVDFDQNGNNELIVFMINSGTRSSARAELYSLTGNNYRLIGETKLDSRVLTYTSIKQEEAENDIRLYVDALGSSGSSKLTEVIYYSNSYSSIISPFYSYSSGTTSGTSRNCLVNCMDINDDGLVEIPTDAEIEGLPENIAPLDWKIYKNTVLSHQLYSLYIKDNNYTLIIPDEYFYIIKADYNKADRELSIFDENDSPVFSIKPVLKAVYDEKNYKDYTLLLEDSGYYYLTKIYSNENIPITLDELKNYIKTC